ncbi:Hypothetical protein R9X50_00603500 [Acrodontium crateriforme]|uniref:Major facilitator superfamily (MFS) profile domain-containing protein n=1 Tax=Acrodontium crateriforme TaxID=150365 RepID=A0AAQ3M862_9PEZI|nr:Hypothetical protein R9X50_00603500 [Acrodontium crateriforme]
MSQTVTLNLRARVTTRTAKSPSVPRHMPSTRLRLRDELPPNYWHSPRLLGTVAALAFGNMSAFASWVMPSNSLAIIDASIGPSNQISWVALAFALGFSVGFLIVGRLSDIFGRRWFFIGGNFLALLSGILGAVATDINTLICGNFLGGLAGSVQLSFPVAIAELVPKKSRPLCVAGIFGSAFHFACFGPVIAQALATETAAGWRWSYYINIIVAGLATVLCFLFYFPPPFHLLHNNRSKADQLKRQDFIGFCLYATGLILFIMGMTWSSRVYPWKSAHVIATIVVGFCSLVAFVLWDAYGHGGDPLLPLHLFKTRGHLAMILTATVGSCVYNSMNVLWPQQITYLFGGTAIHRGFLACVVGSATCIGQVAGGLLCKYIKRSRIVLVSGATSLLVFSSAMVSVNPGQQSKGVVLMFMACFSVGIIETCSLALAPLSLPSEDIGAALGTLSSIRSAGAAVATAVYITILTSKLSTLVPKYVTEAALSAGLPKSSLASVFAALTTDHLSMVPDMTPAAERSIIAANAMAGADSFRFVWYAVIAFAVCAVIAACLTIDYGDHLTGTVERSKTTQLETTDAEKV